MKFINMPLSEKEKRMIRECSQPDPEQPKQPKSPEEQRRIATMAFEAVYADKLNLKDGEPCSHKGCLSHISHPCEGCGRIRGKYMTTDKNKDVAEALGLCWHEWKHYFDTNLEESRYRCVLCNSWNEREEHPKFDDDAGAVQLLRLMREFLGSGEWHEFLMYIKPTDTEIETYPEAIDEFVYDYITTKGKLLDAVAEWFGWNKYAANIKEAIDKAREEEDE